MPATRLVCPHCEKSVEIQVSNVTRSRPCPECGQMVMLQMAEKSTKMKRRALLMTQEEAPASQEPPPRKEAYDPQPLPGDAFERMRKDPEVQAFRKKLIIGSSAAGAVILLLVIFSLLSPEAPPSKASPEAETAEPARPKPKSSVEEMLPPPVTSGNLVFRPVGGQTTTAKAQEAPVPEDLVRLHAGEEAVREFLGATDWRKRALLVRDQLRVAPLMSDYYSKNSDAAVSFDSVVEPRMVTPRFTEHVVVFEGGGRRPATVEHTPSGPRVDWEAFVGSGEMLWSDFLEKRPAQPKLFRVLVSPAGHYENQFSSPAQLKCYSLRVISEIGAKVVYGYLPRQSTISKEIDFWLERNNEEAVPLVLRLKYPLDAVADFQVWIHSLEQAGWVVK